MNQPTSNRLPAEFAALEPFVAHWGLSNERDRYHRLIDSTLLELRVFFDAVLPLAEAMAIRLNTMDASTLDEQDRNLFYLLMTYIETAHPIELDWPSTDIEDSFEPTRMQFGPVSCVSPI